MMTAEILAKSFLSWMNTYAIVALALFLFLTSRKNRHSGLIFLLALTMMYNTILKMLFKFPLPPTCPSSGYGFPSGHMNFISVFYIWLIMENKNSIIRGALGILWGVSGAGMVLAGYHYARDVMITPLFALFFVLIYKRLETKLQKNSLISSALSLATAFLVILLALTGSIQHHVSLAYSSILGFSLASVLCSAMFKPKEKLQRKQGIIISANLALFFYLASKQNGPFCDPGLEVGLITTFAAVCFLRPLISLAHRRIVQNQQLPAEGGGL